MNRAGDSGHRVTLKRKDMIVFEQRLKDAIASLFSFKTHSIHFPRSAERPGASWDAAENKILLPLGKKHEEVLGVFVARGVPQKVAALLIPHWPALSALITDNLLQYKRSLCDPVTGLFTRHYLLHCLEREIETLRDPIRTAPPMPGTATDPAAGSIARVAVRGEGLVGGEEEGPRRASVGTLVVRLAALRDVVREFSYQFADELMIALADALVEACPEQAVAARTSDSEFAVHLPSASPRTCRALATDIVQALRKVFVVHPLRRERVGISASVGYTLYPQDMSGALFVRPSGEQARFVLRKARLAAALADESIVPFPGRSDTESVMGFGRILSEGGRVLENLPLSRVIVSLGSSMHAREGLRFSVWSTHFPGHSPEGDGGSAPLAPLYKGEIVLMEVRDNVSQAEVIHLGEPGWNIEPGDHLLLLREEQGSQAQGSPGEARLDPATGLLRHGDFLACWAEEREKSDRFALALVRLAPKNRGFNFTDADAADARQPDAGEDGAGAGSLDLGDALADAEQTPGNTHPGRFMAGAVRLCREELGQNMLGGRYGLNSLIFFHPDPDDDLEKRYQKLARELEDRLGLDVAVGIASHPYLDFRKADSLENSRKALEYGMLLPKPHVGSLDSLALNISADKRFSQGDTFGAIKEYQLALLADENNSMAWNSLGICLAGLSRYAEAERHFTRALECNPKDAMALYNLGHVYQSQGLETQAKARYEECLRREPDHLFAMVRLGQIAENAGSTGAARALYEKAAILPGGESLTYRHFARLCISEGNPDEAREHLHEALLTDPQDAFAMALLARLYLDAGEDPDMAASLARQSVSLRPNLKAGWLQLARAMEALGKEREAKDARLKAGEV